jgi:DNA-binding response OmpR family regulator
MPAAHYDLIGMDARPHSSQATILVVEDDLGIRSMLELALAAAGYRVRSAANSREAVEALACTAVDLVLLDRHLSGEAGSAVVPVVNRGRIPVVMMSADDREVSRGSGSPWLQKPFTLEELFDAVERSVGDAGPPVGAGRRGGASSD